MWLLRLLLLLSFVALALVLGVSRGARRPARAGARAGGVTGAHPFACPRWAWAGARGLALISRFLRSFRWAPVCMFRA